ncbi:retrovirus-related pol polyprotein from transposon TNT 1-94 [Tanacetum coccineum]
MGNSNVIPYEQYLSVNDISVVPSCASSALNSVCVSPVNDAFVPHDPIATELKIYKEQAKKAQPALYDGDELLKPHHVPVMVPSSEEELELAEATRNKLHVKMNDSACVEKRGDTDPTFDLKALVSQNKDLTAKLNALHDLNECFRAENAKVKQHYKELYDSIKITLVRSEMFVKHPALKCGGFKQVKKVWEWTGNCLHHSAIVVNPTVDIIGIYCPVRLCISFSGIWTQAAQNIWLEIAHGSGISFGKKFNWECFDSETTILVHLWDMGIMALVSVLYESVVITHEKTVPRTPQQNGVVERRNRTLVEAARTMLIFSKASLFLWAEAMDTGSLSATNKQHRRSGVKLDEYGDVLKNKTSCSERISSRRRLNFEESFARRSPGLKPIRIFLAMSATKHDSLSIWTVKNSFLIASLKKKSMRDHQKGFDDLDVQIMSTLKEKLFTG